MAPSVEPLDGCVWSALVPELLVRDVEASLRFWCGLVGFRVVYERREEGFAYVELGEAQVMLEQRDEARRQWVTGALQPPLGRGINLQIAVADADAVVARLAEAGWPLSMEAEDRWYRAGSSDVGQRQLLVQDPDGYLLRLAEDLGTRPARN